MVAPTRVPVPDAPNAVDAGQAARRSDFPLAVSPENPLRFPPVAARDGGPREIWRPVTPEARPLVARRVQGVTAMPYERLGYALLPGWTGGDAPSALRAADAPAPRGTLWARQAEQNAAELARSAGLPAGEVVAIDRASNRFRR